MSPHQVANPTLATDVVQLLAARIMTAGRLTIEVTEEAFVAEGIETLEQLALVRSHGCQQGQGFLLARPLAAVGAIRNAD
jgi:EAL domain-containing protein (putative c-di-GMP-specific phosphodiesterase class I)